MAVDISGVSYFLPIFSFLIVFIISFVVLVKVKLTDNVWFQVFIALLIATMFISFAGARQYIENVIPWVAVVLVSMFLLLLLTGLFGKFDETTIKGAGIIFLVVLFFIFIVSAFIVFSSYISPYLPWTEAYKSTYPSTKIMGWLGSPRISGAVLLAIVAALVSWILVKAK